jgi:hypothetical protein
MASSLIEDPLHVDRVIQCALTDAAHIQHGVAIHMRFGILIMLVHL